MSSSKNKGKGIQKAKDYQLEVPSKIPTHNQFQTLANFSPLSYKTIVSKPAAKPVCDNTYQIRHTEHLFLNSYKTIPSPEIIKPLIQRTFGKNSLLLMTHQKPNNSMNLSLWTPSPLILHIPTTKLTQDIFYSPNALFAMFLVLSNGKIHLKRRLFHSLCPSNI